MAQQAQYLGTGKRKTSVARVILRPGDGKTWFNGRTLEDYFPRMTHRMLALAPLKTAGVEGTFDLRVRVHGGGPSGQAGAVRHGIARALVEADPELRIPLKREGYLTRDARQVERKKAGLHKARKAPAVLEALTLPCAASRSSAPDGVRGSLRRGPDRREPRPSSAGKASARLLWSEARTGGPRLRRPRHPRLGA